MAIKINNNTVIDDSQNITNIADITASGTVNGGIVATTAEAQAASADNVIMTPLKVKEAIQGGTISVIKSVQRFSLRYVGASNRLGAHTSISSSPAGATVSSPAAVANYTFVNLPTTVDINKSFLTISVSGVLNHYLSGITNTFETVTIGARLYNSGGGYAGNQVQLTSSVNGIIYSSGGGSDGGFEIYVEVVEFY